MSGVCNFCKSEMDNFKREILSLIKNDEVKRELELEKKKNVELEKENMMLRLELEKRKEQRQYIYVNDKSLVTTEFDFSQTNFDKHINDKYTLEKYKEGKKGVIDVLISFLYFNQGVTILIADESRNKIKLIDSFGNQKGVCLSIFFSLCKNSKSIKEKLEEFGASEESNTFSEKNLKTIFKDIKQYIICKYEENSKKRAE